MPDKYLRNEFELQITKELAIALIQAGRLTIDEDVTRFLKAAFPVVQELIQSN